MANTDTAIFFGIISFLLFLALVMPVVEKSLGNEQVTNPDVEGLKYTVESFAAEDVTLWSSLGAVGSFFKSLVKVVFFGYDVLPFWVQWILFVMGLICFFILIKIIRGVSS